MYVYVHLLTMTMVDFRSFLQHSHALLSRFLSSFPPQWLQPVKKLFNLLILKTITTLAIFPSSVVFSATTSHPVAFATSFHATIYSSYSIEQIILRNFRLIIHATIRSTRTSLQSLSHQLRQPCLLPSSPCLPPSPNLFSAAFLVSTTNSTISSLTLKLKIAPSPQAFTHICLTPSLSVPPKPSHPSKHHISPHANPHTTTCHSLGHS